MAIIRNARSTKLGKKDIIKIEGEVDISFDVLGFIDDNITIDIIKNGVIVDKKKLVQPQTLKNVIMCKNPRCITTIEEGIDHIFTFCEDGSYRCIYCEQEFVVKI